MHSVCDCYELEQHHVRLLTLACSAWDRCEQARQALKRHGLICKDRFDQPRARPEVSIERDNRLAFARMVRELSLDVSTPDESRPPIIVGNARLRAIGE